MGERVEPRGRRRIAWLVAVLALACGRIGDREAEAVVRRYVNATIEAYRTGDEVLVAAVAGPEEARKIGAVIGVKRDLGLTLDARLLELAVTGVERDGGEVRVATRERWWYQELRIGSGERVGPDSVDTYRMRYRLARVDGRWVVAAVDFAAAPEVGREVAPPAADVGTLHGFPSREPPAEPPAPARPAPAPAKEERP